MKPPDELVPKQELRVTAIKHAQEPSYNFYDVKQTSPSKVDQEKRDQINFDFRGKSDFAKPDNAPKFYDFTDSKTK